MSGSVRVGRRRSVGRTIHAYACMAAATVAPASGQKAILPEVATVGRGPTVLLVVPCGACRWRSFDEFAERNAERYTTVAVTLPGYGGTPLPDLPTFGTSTPWHRHAVDALEALIEERDLRDVIVVGHSFGASIGLQLVSRRPDRIRGFVSLDATLPLPVDRAEWTLDQRVDAAESVRREYMEPLADLDAWQRWNMPSIERVDR